MVDDHSVIFSQSGVAKNIGASRFRAEKDASWRMGTEQQWTMIGVGYENIHFDIQPTFTKALLATQSMNARPYKFHPLQRYVSAVVYEKMAEYNPYPEPQDVPPYIVVEGQGMLFAKELSRMKTIVAPHMLESERQTIDQVVEEQFFPSKEYNRKTPLNELHFQPVHDGAPEARLYEHSLSGWERRIDHKRIRFDAIPHIFRAQESLNRKLQEVELTPKSAVSYFMSVQVYAEMLKKGTGLGLGKHWTSGDNLEDEKILKFHNTMADVSRKVTPLIPTETQNSIISYVKNEFTLKT